MNERIGPVCLLLVLVLAVSGFAQDTVFFSGFEFARTEPLYGLLEAGDLNGAVGQVGFWSGDDFPEADASGHSSGGVLGGDSAGLVEGPQSDGQLLFIDRPLDNAVHFMNLTREVPNPGTSFSLRTGNARDAAGDYDFFGLDAVGNESFHIRIGASPSLQRLGYVSGGNVSFDLPTPQGVDDVGDFSAIGLPPFGDGANLPQVSVNLLGDGYTVHYRSPTEHSQYTTSLIPYNGDASTLARVGVSYQGDEVDSNLQSSFYIDDVRVTVGDPVDPPRGGFGGYVDSSQRIVLEGDGQNVFGIELVSDKGLLIPPADQDASPFGLILASSPNLVTLGNLGTGLIVDGEVVTSVGYSGSDPESELVAFWGDQAADLFKFVVANPQPVSGYINAAGKIVVEGSDKQLRGLDFSSEQELLVPAPLEDPDPFDFLLSNDPGRITYGNLGSTLLLDGELILGAGYRGNDPKNDLVAQWGDEVGTSHFFLVRSGGFTPLDCNGDGVVDEQDLKCICGVGSIDQLLDQLGLLKGDVDADGKVDFSDFLFIGNNFLETTHDYTEGDLNCDGIVDFADFLFLANNFGMSSGAAAEVPEPSSTWLLLGFLPIAMLSRRRSRPILNFRTD